MTGDHPEVEYVPKGWGYEEIVVNKPEYCGKRLTFVKGKQCSLHYHLKKDETFFVLEGKVTMLYFDDYTELQKKVLQNASEREILSMCESIVLEAGDTFYVPQGRVHRVIALQDSKVIEFSTEHFDEDSIRLIKGD